MQFDRHLTARYWLETAREDLIVADDYAERLPHIACFHAQQAAEKALKAVLTDLIGDAPRTHVAHELIAELTAAAIEIPDEVAEAARGLDKYYAPTRYPDALGGAQPGHAFVRSDATNACFAAHAVVKWCAQTLSG
jgi:HEPN domain-containing protein